jgi:hypothetical protein
MRILHAGIKPVYHSASGQAARPLLRTTARFCGETLGPHPWPAIDTEESWGHHPRRRSAIIRALPRCGLERRVGMAARQTPRLSSARRTRTAARRVWNRRSSSACSHSRTNSISGTSRRSRCTSFTRFTRRGRNCQPRSAHGIWFAPSTQFNDPWDAGGAVTIVRTNAAIEESVLKLLFADQSLDIPARRSGSQVAHQCRSCQFVCRAPVMTTTGIAVAARARDVCRSLGRAVPFTL